MTDRNAIDHSFKGDLRELLYLTWQSISIRNWQYTVAGTADALENLVGVFEHHGHRGASFYLGFVVRWLRGTR